MTATHQVKKLWANRTFAQWTTKTPQITGHHQFIDEQERIQDGDVVYRSTDGGKVTLHVQTPDRGEVPLAETTGWKWREAL